MVDKLLRILSICYKKKQLEQIMGFLKALLTRSG